MIETIFKINLKTVYQKHPILLVPFGVNAILGRVEHSNVVLAVTIF